LFLTIPWPNGRVGLGVYALQRRFGFPDWAVISYHLQGMPGRLAWWILLRLGIDWQENEVRILSET
jgi:hypothetical protein